MEDAVTARVEEQAITAIRGRQRRSGPAGTEWAAAYGADVGLLLSRLVAVEQERDAAQAEALRQDDPQWDGTDAAHPAWWRGQEYGALAVARMWQETLDGQYDGKGKCDPAIQEPRDRTQALLASLAAARAEAERQEGLIAALSRAIIADVDEARQGLEGVRAAFLIGKDGSAAADRIFAALSRLRNAVPQEHDWVAKQIGAALAGKEPKP